VLLDTGVSASLDDNEARDISG